MATPTQYGGYEYEFVQTPPERVLCLICKYPSRDPRMTLCCGHAFCGSCLDGQKQAKSVSYACPMCRKEEPEFKTVPYKALDREIRELHIYCANKERGCEWQGELNNINYHLGNNDGCQFEEVKCSNECGKMIERRYLTNHVETECPRRKVSCLYCHGTGEHHFIEGQHKKQCPKIPLPCPNNCGAENISYEHIEAHRKECPYEMVDCEYFNVGCQERMTRKDQEKHKKEKMDDHLMMMQTKFFEMQQMLQTSYENKLCKVKEDLFTELQLFTTKDELVTKDELAAIKNELMTTKEELAAAKDELHATKQQLANLSVTVQQIVRKSESTTEQLSVELSATKELLSATKKEMATVGVISNDLFQTKKRLSAVDDNLNMTKADLGTTLHKLSSKLSETTSQLSKDLQATKNELATTKQELDAVKEKCHDVADLKRVTRNFNQKFEETEQSLNTLQRRFSTDIKKLEDNQQKAQLDQWTLRLHTLSISGDKTCPVIVKVSEVADKKRNKTKWHSYPFYTHDKGYKMCLRVIINGTGQGEGSHMSVFLYLMKGVYDGGLAWPLIGSFDIVLLNQKMDGEHYINNPIKFTEKTPSAIANKVSSKQPDEIARDGLGRNEFIRHEELWKETDTCQFLKNDCIFVRVRQLPGATNPRDLVGNQGN